MTELSAERVDAGIATRPYPWPWDGRVDPARLCLVLAGVQRCHADATPGHADVVDTLNTISEEIRAAGGTVCHLRHTTPPGWAGRVRPLLPPAETSTSEGIVEVGTGDLVVTCAGHDGFFASGLDNQLRDRGVLQLVVGGLAAEVTVSSTVRSANDKGYECLTLTDAYGALDPVTAAGELKSITMSGGIFGAIGTSSWLVEKLKNAR